MRSGCLSESSCVFRRTELSSNCAMCTMECGTFATDARPRSCAVAHFDSGDLDIYYQFYKTDDRGRSSMPDILLMQSDKAGPQALVVVDPKHGRSYSKGRVSRTLRRYSKEHDAVLTAVVNYYPVAGYQFKHQADGVRHTVLASDVQPGSQATQLFELVLAEILTASNFRKQDPDPSVGL